MSQSDRDREDRAFEALIVSQFRRERDPNNVNDLPELNEEERAAMQAMPEDLVQRLWNQAEVGDQTSADGNNEEENAQAVDEELFVGMNRGDGLPEETYEKLDDARKEVVEELKKARQPKEDDDAKS